MLHEWEKQYPGRTEIIFQSIQKVTLSHLMDGKLFDFKNLSQTLNAEDGDTVFDEPGFQEQGFHEPEFQEPGFDVQRQALPADEAAQIDEEPLNSAPNQTVVELKQLKAT